MKIQLKVLGVLIALLGLIKFYWIYPFLFMMQKQPSLQLIMTLFITLVFGISGIGVILLKKWARILLLVISPIGFSLQIFGLIFMKDFSVNSIVYTVLFLAVIYCFTHPKVKEQFA